MTSSISCSTTRRASKVPLMRGRVNENGCAELSVTMPSNGPFGPIVPSANMACAVFNRSARPFALDVAIFAANGLPGRRAVAILSMLVVASALRALMKSFHGMSYGTKKLCPRMPSSGGKGLEPGQTLGLGLGVAVGLALALALGLGVGPPVE